MSFPSDFILYSVDRRISVWAQGPVTCAAIRENSVKTSITIMARPPIQIGRELRLPMLRSLSTPASTVSVRAFEEVHSQTNTTQRRPTLGSILTSTPSESFILGLTQTHLKSTFLPKQTNAGKVKREILGLLANKNYDELLKVMAKWVGAAKTSGLGQVLTPQEFSHVMSFLVKYQIGTITRAASEKTKDSDSYETRKKFAHAHEVRERLRFIYSSLLYGKGHLYDRSNRQELYTLNTLDYENLISLELSNGKLDLAQKWLRHIEEKYPNGTFNNKFSYNLWILKLKVIGGAATSLWRLPSNELYEKSINPRRLRLSAERQWLEVFDDFTRNQLKSLGNSHYVFDKPLIIALLRSIAYSKNVPQLAKLVELNWGITKLGKLLANFQKPALGDPMYPDLDVLRTIVVSMVFNNEFIPSMAYINAFQDHYGLVLNSTRSKVFWDQMFRWCEMTTRYSEYRALQHYIKETGSDPFLRPSSEENLSVSLEEAKKSVHFDYEGFLSFLADLRNRRVGLIQELWKCHHRSDPGFSVKVYVTYLRIATEYPLEERFNELLTQLAMQHHLHLVSPHSFNAPAAERKLKSIGELYAKTLKSWLEYKGQQGQLGQMLVIVNKWSLDEHMSKTLSEWVQGEEGRYLELLSEKQLQEEKDDEEEFLGLM